jgi:hypothetical protein
MWKRRELLGALGTGAAGLALLARTSAAATDDSDESDSKHAAMLRDCDEACGHCEAACQKAFRHCINQASAGKLNHARMAQTVADCAAFCSLSAELIARHSAFMALSCQACGQACSRCARECESFANDPAIKACMAACQKCEETCRNMVRMMGADSVTAPDRPAGRSELR